MLRAHTGRETNPRAEARPGSACCVQTDPRAFLLCSSSKWLQRLRHRLCLRSCRAADRDRRSSITTTSCLSHTPKFSVDVSNNPSCGFETGLLWQLHLLQQLSPQVFLQLAWSFPREPFPLEKRFTDDKTSTSQSAPCAWTFSGSPSCCPLGWNTSLISLKRITSFQLAN